MLNLLHLCFINGTKPGWQHMCLQQALLNISKPLLIPTAQKKSFLSKWLFIADVPGQTRALMVMYSEIHVVFMPAKTIFIP